MRPDGIIVMAPSFDQHFGLLKCREDLRVQEFVSELLSKVDGAVKSRWPTGFLLWYFQS